MPQYLSMGHLPQYVSTGRVQVPALPPNKTQDYQSTWEIREPGEPYSNMSGLSEEADGQKRYPTSSPSKSSEGEKSALGSFISQQKRMTEEKKTPHSVSCKLHSVWRPY